MADGRGDNAPRQFLKVDRCPWSEQKYDVSLRFGNGSV